MIDAIVKVAYPIASALLPWVIDQVRAGKDAAAIRKGLLIQLRREAIKQVHDASLKAR